MTGGSSRENVVRPGGCEPLTFCSGGPTTPRHSRRGFFSPAEVRLEAHALARGCAVRSLCPGPEPYSVLQCGHVDQRMRAVHQREWLVTPRTTRPPSPRSKSKPAAHHASISRSFRDLERDYRFHRPMAEVQASLSLIAIPVGRSERPDGASGTLLSPLRRVPSEPREEEQLRPPSTDRERQHLFKFFPLSPRKSPHPRGIGCSAAWPRRAAGQTASCDRLRAGALRPARPPRLRAP
jgi:hypothetical protein